MNIPSVEDIESVHPLELDDEGEGLPAYEESVSSGLSSFATDDMDSYPSFSHSDPAYESHVVGTARKRLSEKGLLKLAIPTDGQSSAASPGGSSAYSHDTSLPPYQPPTHAAAHPLAHSLSRKYGQSRAAHITELTRTGLARVDFGSAYAQQSMSTITCALSLYGGALVLFGTADGLRVVNVSEEVPMRVVWTGLPVWDIRVLRCIEDGDKTPRGSVAVLCGGTEDPGRPGKPRTKAGGEVEVRIWRLGSLASLARWTAGRPMGWKGLDMTPVSKKGKGKERSFFSPFSQSKKTSMSTGSEPSQPTDAAVKLAMAWAADWIRLDSSTSGKRSDIVDFSLRQSEDKVYIAIATTSHILLHVGVVVPSGVSFRSTRKFYLPFPPTTIGLLDVLTPSDESSLGIWISFGTGGMGIASVIRNSDSAVLDFKPPSGQGAGKGGAGWTETQNVWSSGKELYAFHRGGETMIYPSPLRLPIAAPPVILTTWPRMPLSSLVAPDGEDLLLITTSGAGEICTQRARSTGEGYRLDLQDGTPIGDGRILPLAWGYVKDGVYVSIKEMKEWRICAIEKV